MLFKKIKDPEVFLYDKKYFMLNRIHALISDIGMSIIVLIVQLVLTNFVTSKGGLL